MTDGNKSLLHLVHRTNLLNPKRRQDTTRLVCLLRDSSVFGLDHTPINDTRMKLWWVSNNDSTADRLDRKTHFVIPDEVVMLFTKRVPEQNKSTVVWGNMTFSVLGEQRWPSTVSFDADPQHKKFEVIISISNVSLGCVKKRFIIENPQEDAKSDHKASHEEQDCPLCLEPLGQKKTLETRCNQKGSAHIFHRDCFQLHIDSCRQRSLPIKCPLCRSLVSKSVSDTSPSVVSRWWLPASGNCKIDVLFVDLKQANGSPVTVSVEVGVSKNRDIAIEELRKVIIGRRSAVGSCSAAAAAGDGHVKARKVTESFTVKTPEDYTRFLRMMCA